MVFTETQGGGVVSYTSTAGFSGIDTFSYKASDGVNESEVAQMSIDVREKEAGLNWSTFYSSTTLNSSAHDNQGNTYMAGEFFDFSNFKDNTTLNAIYAQSRDGYIAKYDSQGQLIWVNTFGGALYDSAHDIKIDSDGNIIASGSIQRTATFSDGEQLGDNSLSPTDNYAIVLKLNGNTGEIIWKSYTELFCGDTNDRNFISIRNDNKINLITNNKNWNDEDGLKILEFDLNGSFEIAGIANGFAYRVFSVESDDNDNVRRWRKYNGQYAGELVKFDSNYNEVWDIELEGNNPFYDVIYDPLNNLIYTSGIAKGANLNPLGEGFTPNYTDEQGHFFAAYNDQGILQFVHLFSISSFDYA